MATNTTPFPALADRAIICNDELNELPPTAIMRSMPEAFIDRSLVLQAIKNERDKWKKFRTEMGLGPNEVTKFRRERWAITTIRLMTLDSVEKEITESLEVFSNLTCRKSIFSFIFETALIHGGWVQVFKQRGMVEKCAIHRHKQTALNDLLVSLSGSAGTQPKTCEKESLESTGTTPVTVPAVPPCSDDLVALFGSSILSIATDDLRKLSEAILDELDARGEADGWSLTHSGVGEGDAGLNFGD